MAQGLWCNGPHVSRGTEANKLYNFTQSMFAIHFVSLSAAQSEGAIAPQALGLGPLIQKF